MLGTGMTSLADIMRRDVLGVAPEDTLGFAAEQMAERDVGAVVVVDYGRLIGILSERDILRAVAGRVHSSEARVRDWMTADPKTASPQTPPEEAARVMVEHGFRHLPVVEDEQAVGIVSIRDVMRWTVQETVEAGPAEAGSST
jgi:CBS domain-containing protein